MILRTYHITLGNGQVLHYYDKTPHDLFLITQVIQRTICIKGVTEFIQANTEKGVY